MSTQHLSTKPFKSKKITKPGRYTKKTFFFVWVCEWCSGEIHTQKKKEFNVQSNKRFKSDKNPKEDKMQEIFELKGDKAFK